MAVKLVSSMVKFGSSKSCRCAICGQWRDRRNVVAVKVAGGVVYACPSHPGVLEARKDAAA